MFSFVYRMGRTVLTGAVLGTCVFTAAAFAQATPGSKEKIVVEIAEAAANGAVQGKVLQKKTEEIYVRTDIPVTLQTTSQTKFVMGKAADLRPGAVVHVTGTVRVDRGLDVEQIVILTGYVRVE